jgi:hypothetical protein
MNENQCRPSLIREGLHFPAADIPKQARDLYVLNRIRLLYDRDADTARLVCYSLIQIFITYTP